MSTKRNADASKTANSKAKTTTPKPKPKGRGRQKKGEQVISLDNDDPFNFDTNVNNHPEPLHNFNVQKGNFGDLKFVRSPPTDVENRYANTEKAVSRAIGSTSQSALTPTIRPQSLMEMTVSTPEVRKALTKAASAAPASTKKRGRKSKTSTSAANETGEEEDVFEPPTDPKRTPKTPRKRHESPPLLAAKPKIEIETPELTADEQLKADQSDEPYPNGTRVYALWGHDYYPGIVIDRDGLGRYKVEFSEDAQRKDVPGTGVIPLSQLEIGKQVAITSVRDGVSMVVPVKILGTPSKTDAQEWSKGEYHLVEVNEDGSTVSDAPEIHQDWKTLIITKLQQKEHFGKRNLSIVVDSHNVVPKGTRRSRLSTALIKPEPQEEKPKASRQRSSAAKARINGDTPTTDVKESLASRTPKKRGRKPAISAATSKSESPPAKRAAHAAQPEENGDVEDDVHTEETQYENVFQGRYFMLTSSARRQQTAGHQFNKREYKQLIEERGGIVAEEVADLAALPEETEAFLVADAYYRTHKYLYALAASIPCVNFLWINACVEKGELVDWRDHLLPAGASVIDDQEFLWKPLKGKLFKGKTIFVHSVNVDNQHENLIPFAEIWRPLLNLLGAEVITTNSTDTDEILEFAKSHSFDYMLTDRTCLPQVRDYTTEKGVDAVSSNWIIHAIVTGEFANVSDHPSFAPESQ